MTHAKKKLTIRVLNLKIAPKVYTILFFLTSLGYSLQSSAQLDSLITELAYVKTDSVRLDLLNKIAFSYRSKNADSTLFYGWKAHDLAKDLNDSKWVGRSYYSIGVGFHIKGVFDSAVYYYKKGILLSKIADDQTWLAKFYNNLGLVDWNKGELRTGLNYFLQSFKIDEVLGDSSGMVTSINNIGLIHRALGEDDQALDYFLRAKRILESIGGDFRLSQVYNNLGSTYVNLEIYDTALLYYRQSLKYADISNANCYKAHPTLGIAELLQKGIDFDPDSLIYYGTQALQLAKTCGLPKIQSSAVLFLGDAYRQIKEDASAEKFYIEGLELAKQYNISQNIKDASQRLYFLYKYQKKWELSVLNLEIFEKTKSTMQGEEKIREITRIEAEYQSEKEKQLLLAKQESERLIYEKEKNFYLIFAVSSLALMFLLAFIYRREKRISNTLSRKNRLISELSTFKSDLTQMIAHDIKNPLNSIIALSFKLEEKVGKDIAKAGQAILRLITNMLDVEKFEDAAPALLLEPVELSKLVAEAQLAVELLMHDKAIQLEIEIDQDVKLRVDREMLIRVLVNLLSNGIKYSNSNSSMRIESKVTSISGHSYVRIGIRDEGPGIPEEDQPYLFEKFYQAEARRSGLTPSTGLGLTFCKLAINAHDGSISVDSRINEGTTFWITLRVDELMGKGVQIIKGKPLEVSQDELKILSSYSTKLKELKVYNVSAIMAILDEIENQKFKIPWIEQVRSAVRYSNEDQFENLLKMIK